MQATRRELDDRKGVPLWHRIEGVLRHKILTGEYPLDTSLPSESALAAEYGVSRLTIREAIRGLRVEGMVQQIQGKGTFVRRVPAVGSVAGLTTAWVGSFEMNIAFPAFSQKVPHHSLIEIHTVERRPDVRSSLKLDETTVVSIKRILMNQGAPLAFIQDICPMRLATGYLRSCSTGARLTEALVKYFNVSLVEMQQTIQATVADAILGERLDVAFGSPLLYSEGISSARIMLRLSPGSGIAPIVFECSPTFHLQDAIAREGRPSPVQSEAGMAAAERDS